MVKKSLTTSNRWCLTKDGEQSATGVSEVVISDGDHYELTYTIG